MERVHFSNLFGTAPLVIGGARLSVAIGSGPGVDPSRDVPLTFNGAAGITLAAGAETVSDAVSIRFVYGEHLAISMYLPGSFPALTEHTATPSQTYLSAAGAGNVTADTSGSRFDATSGNWFVTTGVDVYGAYQGTVAVFGSSNMDGHNSDFGDTNAYPIPNASVAGQDDDRPSDWLARSLAQAGYRLGVLNAGEIADPAGHDAYTENGSSVAGIDRMQHDVLSQPGIKAVVIYFGGIDLRVDCEPATTIEGYLTNMVSQAQTAGVRVILATLPPAEYCLSTPGLLPTPDAPFLGDLNPGPENPGSAQRRALNTWIRTTGVQLPGVVGIADFDAVLAYAAHPDFMIPNLNSGDNFHPNGPGYGVQNSAIPLSAVLPSSN